MRTIVLIINIICWAIVFYFSAIFADKVENLGKLVIESHIGEILDAKVILPKKVAQSATVRQFRLADKASYAVADVKYTELHEQLLIEPVLSAVSPYIAISSLTPVNQSRFEVLIHFISTTEQRLHYKFRLRKIPLVEPPVRKKQPIVLNANEVLFGLLNILKLKYGISKAELMAELKKINGEGQGKLIFSLAKEDFSPQWIDGFKRLMEDNERQVFAKAVSDKGFSIAFAQTLFIPSSNSLLTRLLEQGLLELPELSTQQDDKLERNAAMIKNARRREQLLQNRIVDLQSKRFLVPDIKKTKIRKLSSIQTIASHMWNLILSRSFWIVMVFIFASLFLISLYKYVYKMKLYK